MMTVAKALGGGLPIGVTLVTDAVAEVMQVGDHGSTFAGGPVICRAAEVVLKRVSDPAFLAHVRDMGSLLTERLEEIHSPRIKDIRGSGLMVGVEFDIEVAPLIQAGLDHGVLMLNAGTKVLRLLPPLIVEANHVDQFVNTLDQILSETAA
jgi:acetylornithine/succinyldiaminopimelate/putrescine aminotransferase